MCVLGKYLLNQWVIQEVRLLFNYSQEKRAAINSDKASIIVFVILQHLSGQNQIIPYNKVIFYNYLQIYFTTNFFWQIHLDAVSFETICENNTGELSWLRLNDE